jgi:hypothetical protein
MHNVISLSELTTSQLEAAIEVGEGADEIVIKEILEQKTLESQWVAGPSGDVYQLPTVVKYKVILKDDMHEDGEFEATVYVKVTALGIVANY